LARKQDKADRLERECHHLEEEFMSSPENALIVDARRNLDFAQEAAKEAESKLNDAEKLIASAKRFLPDGISHIHRQRLEQLAAGMASIDWDGFEEPSENESLPPAQQAAIVRGEVPCTCSCNDGHLVVKDDSDGVDVFIELDDRIRHPLCEQQSRFDGSLLTDAVPASHANLRVHSLGTWDKSPIPVAKQKGPIAGIPSSADGLRGWLMAGPAGTSKTSYAAAAVIDILTFRIVEWQRRNTGYDSTSLGSSLNYWRVKAPKWIRDMEMFETRDFDSDAVVPEPWPTPQLIEKATVTSGFKPILWLEELDKFNPTQNRMRNLYTLIDGVYEAGGTIISTTNMTLPDLKKHLGEPIYRRLSGENDDPENFLIWNFFKLCAHKKSTGLSKS
jgi:hypothetical protein